MDESKLTSAIGRENAWRSHIALVELQPEDALQTIWRHTTSNEERAKLLDMRVNGASALIFACWRGDMSVIKWLVQVAKAPVDARSKHSSTALMQACEYGKLDAVKFLVEESKANLEATDQNGWTPFHFACLHGDVDLVSYLLAKGANAAAVTTMSVDVTAAGSTGVDIACQHGKVEVAKLLHANEHQLAICAAYKPPEPLSAEEMLKALMSAPIECDQVPRTYAASVPAPVAAPAAASAGFSVTAALSGMFLQQQQLKE